MNEGKELQLVTFESTHARGILAKLHREIERLQNASEGEFASDHVINAFWTAWHMHVWIWDAIKDQPALRDAVLKYRGIEEENIVSCSSFGTALARRFVPLKICRMIAMSPRHARIVLGSESGAVGSPAFEVEGSSRRAQVSNPPTRGPAETRSVPMVVVMGRPIAVTQLLREVEDYWVTLIHENGVEQLR
jgi:hypothetical protein